jgi:replication factor C subunit 3/5
MSDHDDDMDLDPLAPDSSTQFGSGSAAANGKRIVADLPVEAGDNLPW